MHIVCEADAPHLMVRMQSDSSCKWMRAIGADGECRPTSPSFQPLPIWLPNGVAFSPCWSTLGANMGTAEEWVVRSIADSNYILDCNPERLDQDRWCVQVVISEASGVPVHTCAPRAVAFDSPSDAAAFGFAVGERWIYDHRKMSA